MKRFIIAQSDKEFYTSHSGLALVGLCVNKFSSLPAKAVEAFPVSAASNGIGLDDILRSYVGLLATGQSDYEAVTNRRKDDYFRDSLGIGNVPSAETLRQRLDEVASALRPLCDAGTVEFLKKAGVAITPLDTGHVTLGLRCFRHGQFQDPKGRGFPHLTMARTATRPSGPILAGRGGVWNWNCVKASNTVNASSYLFSSGC